MAKRQLPSPEDLRQLLRYEPETGKLFWKEREPRFCVTSDPRGPEWVAKRWNKRLSGKEALTAKNNGYRVGPILGRMVPAHRVAWALHCGEWPTGQIDHINGIRDDNRIANLRDVSAAENGRNQKAPHDNTSGVIGVGWDQARGKWKASINTRGRTHHLGRFNDFESAVKARTEAERRYGFHPNHGRSARLRDTIVANAAEVQA